MFQNRTVNISVDIRNHDIRHQSVKRDIPLCLKAHLYIQSTRLKVPCADEKRHEIIPSCGAIVASVRNKHAGDAVGIVTLIHKTSILFLLNFIFTFCRSPLCASSCRWTVVSTRLWHQPPILDEQLPSFQLV